MDSSNEEVDFEFLPFLRVYKNGLTERLMVPEFVAPSTDPQSAVLSKDVTLQTETGLSARLYIPHNVSKDQKLPLLIYFHGGGFFTGSAFSPLYHNYLNSVVEECNVVAVSIEYRLAPENPLPIGYEDSWEALQWIDSHLNGEGFEAWLRDYADFDKVFLGGDSAGANIIHNMVLRVTKEVLGNGMKFHAIILIHPYFWGKEVIGVIEGSDPIRKALIDKMWVYTCPLTTGNDDPLINPVAVGAPSFCNLASTRVLVFVAEKDVLRDRGLLYYETLQKSAWSGEAKLIEIGQDHIFYLFNPVCDDAISMMKSLAFFINPDNNASNNNASL